MRIVVLGSGSSGNSTLIETERTRLLIDGGFGTRSLNRRLREAGVAAGSIDAVLVTHGHRDHVAGVQSILKNHRAVLYVNEGTRQETALLDGIDRCEVFSAGQAFQVGDVSVEAFAVPHDSAEPVGFCLSSHGIKGLLATDIGEVTPTLVEQARGCQWLVLEANHDEELLKLGPYPWDLKRRVLGSRGHLSNESLADFVARQFDGEASHLFLAHLSRQNNHPELALETVRRGLSSRPGPRNGHGTQVLLTDQIKPSIVVNV
ncbi:MAG: MBL fold metallo-hydrolase [Acidobacteriota bacterium]